MFLIIGKLNQKKKKQREKEISAAKMVREKEKTDIQTLKEFEQLNIAIEEKKQQTEFKHIHDLGEEAMKRPLLFSSATTFQPT